MKKQTVVLIAFLLQGMVSIAQTPAEKMAEMAMATWNSSLPANQSLPDSAEYGQELILKGIEGLWMKTGDGKYFNYMQKCMDVLVDEQGNINTNKQQGNTIDNILYGRVLLTLYRVTGSDKYYKAATTLYNQWHIQRSKGRVASSKKYPYHLWLDGLYTGLSFNTEYADVFHKSKSFADIGREFIWIEKKMRNPKTGLSPQNWAIALGWYGMELVDVLENFPAPNPYRDSLIAILQKYVAAVKKLQRPNGVWYTITGLPYEKGNYFEASASCMFVYAIAKGVRLGALPASYLTVARKGYAGILKTFVKTDVAGLVHLSATVNLSGLTTSTDSGYRYYMRRKVVDNSPTGVGAFIQVANEMDLLASLSIGKGKTVMLDDYFNAERKKDITGASVSWHYQWHEKSNGGFSFLANIFRNHTVATKTLSNAPTAANLKGADIYIIVDADNVADNPTANYVQPADIANIYNWVKNGGVLVLMHNDKPNTEFVHFNKLAKKFGIHFNEDSYNKVVGTNWEMGKIEVAAGNPILPGVKKIYQKEVSTMQLQAPAKAILTKDSVAIFAVAKIGKGTVFATGDPWIYNEYVDGRRLPTSFENAKAAKEWVQWLIRQIPEKKIGL